MLLQLVDPHDLAVERAVREEGKQPRHFDRERGLLVALREAADLEERERRWLLGVPQRLGRGDLHRLVLGRIDAEVTAEPEIYRRNGQQNDQSELRRAPKELDVAAADEVPARDSENERGAHGQTREHRVPERPDGEVGREQRPDVRQHRLPVFDLVADRLLHPRVGDQDEIRREPGAKRRDPDRRQVDARPEPVPAEDPEPEEGRLEHERSEPLDRERGAEDVADELRIFGPVHPELELLDEPGRDPDREVDQEQRPEEARQPEPGLVARAVPEGLHRRDERPEPERQRHEQEVVDRRGRELDPGEIDGRRSERAHARTTLESGSRSHIVRWG